jgi:hypothetical protein
LPKAETDRICLLFGQHLAPFRGFVRLVPRRVKLDNEFTDLLHFLSIEIGDGGSILFHAFVSADQSGSASTYLWSPARLAPSRVQ